MENSDPERVSASSSQPPAGPPTGPKSWVIATVLLVIALGGGILVIKSYLSLLEKQAERQQRDNLLPKIFRLENSIAATERSGERVELADLRGKVLLAGHVFTRCPRGCAGVVAEMKKLHDKFGDHPKLHFVSFSVDPAHDSPEVLRTFADQFDIEAANWWFLTGDADQIHAYLANEFHFEPVRETEPEERLSEADLFVHDLRVALVDHQGHIRGYYSLIGPNAEIFHAKLEKDLAQLLKAAGDEGTKAEFPWWVAWAPVGALLVFIVLMGIRRARADRASEAGAGAK